MWVTCFFKTGSLYFALALAIAHSVDRADIELRDLLSLPSECRAGGLKACVTTTTQPFLGEGGQDIL